MSDSLLLNMYNIELAYLCNYLFMCAFSVHFCVCICENECMCVSGQFCVLFVIEFIIGVSVYVYCFCVSYCVFMCYIVILFVCVCVWCVFVSI